VGKRGPAPKPIEVAIADGTYRPDRHGREPVVLARRLTLDEVKAPEHLSPGQAEAFEYVVELLSDVIEAGAIQEVDAPAVEAMSNSLWLYRKAAAEVASLTRLTIDTPNGSLQQHPAIGTMNKAGAEFRTWCARFGMTPSDRVGLGLQGAKTRNLTSQVADRLGPKTPRSVTPGA
jgi:P27 family predicted phage terminase small subunit